MTATGIANFGTPCTDPGTHALPDLPARDFTFDVPVNVNFTDNRFFYGSAPPFFGSLIDTFPSSAAAIMLLFNPVFSNYTCYDGYTVGPYQNDVSFGIDNFFCTAAARYKSRDISSTASPSLGANESVTYVGYDGITDPTGATGTSGWFLDSFSCNGSSASGTFTMYGSIPSIPGKGTVGVVGYGSFVSL